jgi:hypothetical protein
MEIQVYLKKKEKKGSSPPQTGDNHKSAKIG